MNYVRDDTGTAWGRYAQFDWGDLIEGTKAQLQALGIGQGVAFPGEMGGPKRQLTTTDPRGFNVALVVASKDPLTFRATIEFPDWPVSPDRRPDEWVAMSTGVRRCTDHLRSDRFVGSVDALVAAGLVQPGHFPGMPGMRKTRVTIQADGNPRSHCADWWRQPGARVIERDSKTMYRVTVVVPADEADRRRAAFRASVAAYEELIAKLARPEPLRPVSAAPQRLRFARLVDGHRNESIDTRCATTSAVDRRLRLVWSAGSPVVQA